METKVFTSTKRCFLGTIGFSPLFAVILCSPMGQTFFEAFLVALWKVQGFCVQHNFQAKRNMARLSSVILWPSPSIPRPLCQPKSCPDNFVHCCASNTSLSKGATVPKRTANWSNSRNALSAHGRKAVFQAGCRSGRVRCTEAHLVQRLCGDAPRFCKTHPLQGERLLRLLSALEVANKKQNHRNIRLPIIGH